MDIIRSYTLQQCTYIFSVCTVVLKEDEARFSDFYTNAPWGRRGLSREYVLRIPSVL